jgi:nucleotide-binding universal stress UspA family protein
MPWQYFTAAEGKKNIAKEVITMFKHIMLPTDGSELSNAAVQEGIRFAKSIGARVTGICVMPNQHPFFYEGMSAEVYLELQAEKRKELRKVAEAFLSVVEKGAREAGVPCNAVVETSDHPYEAIVQVAERAGCDLIMMASHGRKGVKAVLLGSETQKVLTHSKIPVLVYR